MLAWRWRFVLALLLAAFSAIGLGIGLLSLGPALSLILDPEQGKSLLQLAGEYNAGDHIVQVPGWLISMLPDGRFDGVIFILIGVGVPDNYWGFGKLFSPISKCLDCSPCSR